MRKRIALSKPVTQAFRTITRQLPLTHPSEGLSLFVTRGRVDQFCRFKPWEANFAQTICNR